MLGRKSRHTVKHEVGTNPAANRSRTVTDTANGIGRPTPAAAVNAPAFTQSDSHARLGLRDVSVIVNTHMVAGSLKGWLAKGAGGRADAIPLLQNVTLSIRPGDRLGIVGRNGQGKTVLSKVLAGIYPPTSGKRDACGQIAAVLATGMGLDGELTVRDNVKLGMAYLGELRSWSPEKEASIL